MKPYVINICFILAAACILFSCKYIGRPDGGITKEIQVADKVCASSEISMQIKLAAEIVHSGRMLYDYKSDTLSTWAEDMNLYLVVVRGDTRKDYLLTKEEIRDILDHVSEFDYYYSTIVNAEPDTVINKSAFFNIETCIPDSDLNYCFSLKVNPDDTMDMIDWDYYDCEDGLGNYVHPDLSKLGTELFPSVSFTIPENQMITSSSQSDTGILLVIDGYTDKVFPDFVPKMIGKPDLSNLYSFKNSADYQLSSAPLVK